MRTLPPSAPDKGSFPLDHFQECEEEAEKYRICLTKASGIPKKCKEQAKAYLECRMDRGLMAKHSMEELGFVKESSYEYELKSREDMRNYVQNIMKESKQRVYNEYLKKKQQANPPQQTNN